MDDDLNVGNLLETRAERAPTSELPRAASPLLRTKKRTSTLGGFTVAAILVTLAVLIISANSGRRIPVMERY